MSCGARLGPRACGTRLRVEREAREALELVEEVGLDALVEHQVGAGGGHLYGTQRGTLARARKAILGQRGQAVMWPGLPRLRSSQSGL